MVHSVASPVPGQDQFGEDGGKLADAGSGVKPDVHWSHL